MKKLIWLLVVVLAVVGVLAVGKNVAAKAAVQKTVKSMTGLRMDIRKLDVGILSTLLRVEGLKLHNPAGFRDPIMVDLPEIFVDYNLGAIIGGKVHLEEVRLNLNELVIIKNADGELNVNALKPPAKEGKDEPSKPAEPGKPAGKKAAPKIQIDQLALRIGKVVYKDYSKGAQPSVQEFKLNLNERFENITDINALVPLLLGKALMNTTIANLADLDMGQLMSQFDASGMDLQSLGMDKLQGMAGQYGSQAQQALQAAQSQLGGASSGFASALTEVQGKAAAALQSVSEKDKAELQEKAGKALEDLQGFFNKIKKDNAQ